MNNKPDLSVDDDFTFVNNLYSPPKFKFALRADLADDKRFLPSLGTPKATGWDVRAAFADQKPLSLRPFQKALIPLGFRGFCPLGWWYDLKPRSSTFGKKHLSCLYGTIDEDFEGQLLFACQYIPPVAFAYTASGVMEGWQEYMSDNMLTIDFGEAIAQIIPKERHIITVEEATNEELDLLYKERSADRGAGGFGSTGK